MRGKIHDKGRYDKFNKRPKQVKCQHEDRHGWKQEARRVMAGAQERY